MELVPVELDPVLLVLLFTSEPEVLGLVVEPELVVPLVEVLGLVVVVLEPLVDGCVVVVLGALVPLVEVDGFVVVPEDDLVVVELLVLVDGLELFANAICVNNVVITIAIINTLAIFFIPFTLNNTP